MTKISQTILIEPEIIERAKVQARKENRSFNNMIEHALTTFLEPMVGDRDHTPGIQASVVRSKKFIVNQSYYQGSLEEAQAMYRTYVDEIEEYNKTAKFGTLKPIRTWETWLQEIYYPKKK